MVLRKVIEPPKSIHGYGKAPGDAEKGISSYYPV
jgi:hypothetical protein